MNKMFFVVITVSLLLISCVDAPQSQSYPEATPTPNQTRFKDEGEYVVDSGYVTNAAFQVVCDTQTGNLIYHEYYHKDSIAVVPGGCKQ